SLPGRTAQPVRLERPFAPDASQWGPQHTLLELWPLSAPPGEYETRLHLRVTEGARATELPDSVVLGTFEFGGAPGPRRR
ncbi:MAG TPA: hypothetical protein VGQ83_12110, partial [Polyangia bacterium]